MVANDQIALLWRENADLNGIAEKTIGGNTRFCRKPCLKFSRVSPNSFISRLNRLFLLLITILLFHQLQANFLKFVERMDQWIALSVWSYELVLLRLCLPDLQSVYTYGLPDLQRVCTFYDLRFARWRCPMGKDRGS